MRTLGGSASAPSGPPFPRSGERAAGREGGREGGNERAASQQAGAKSDAGAAELGPRRLERGQGQEGGGGVAAAHKSWTVSPSRGRRESRTVPSTEE